MAVKRSKDLTEMFYNFLDNKSPLTRSGELRTILFGYLQFEMKAGINTDLINELSTVAELMDILDRAADKNN